LIVAPGPAANDFSNPGHDSIFVQDTHSLAVVIGLGFDFDAAETYPSQLLGLREICKLKNLPPGIEGQTPKPGGRQFEKISTGERRFL